MDEAQNIARLIEEELQKLRELWRNEKDKGKKALLSLQAKVLEDNPEVYFNIKNTDTRSVEVQNQTLEQKVLDFINYNDDFLKKSGITD